MQTTYGDISPSTAAYVSKDFLKRGMAYLVLEKFGQAKELPGRSTKSMEFRRYNALSNDPKVLVEGVTPAGSKLSVTPINVELTQYGDYVEISDIVQDTHEDPVLQEASEVLAQQAAEMIEKVRYGVLKACVNVFYGGGAANRAAVTAALSRDLQRNVTRGIKRQNGRTITKIVRSTAAYGTENVAPAYVAIVHPDLEPSVRALTDFTPSEKYGSITPWENEIGKCEDVRYVSSTLLEPYADAGSATGAGTTYLSTGGSNCDIYPVIYLASDAYGIVALKGKFAVELMVANPRPTPGADPLAQKGTVGWKSMQAAVILNDAWMAVAEVCAPKL